LSSAFRGVRADARNEIEQKIASDDLAGLLTETGEIHGHFCVGSALGVMAAHHAMKDLGIGKVEEPGRFIAIVETNSCFSDAVQVVTGCTLGNKSLIYRDYGKMVLTLLNRDGEGIRIARKPESGAVLRNRNQEFVKLRNKVVTKGEGTDEDEKRLIELTKNHCYDVLYTPVVKIFKIDRVEVDPPLRTSHETKNCICNKCGETVSETRTVRKDEKIFCLPCAGAEYYQLDWSGISVVREGN
jgi:formylmethanofuran dehydrogenase subunit E